jgi:hypothetical protein
MCWKYMLAKGSAGGILVGFKSQDFEVISWQFYEYFAIAVIKN